jgi:hypothetical protein
VDNAAESADHYAHDRNRGGRKSATLHRRARSRCTENAGKCSGAPHCVRYRTDDHRGFDYHARTGIDNTSNLQARDPVARAPFSGNGLSTDERKNIMNLHLSIGPLIALIAGILILIMPRLLNYIVAVYLIVIGLVGLFGTGNIHL